MGIKTSPFIMQNHENIHFLIGAHRKAIFCTETTQYPIYSDPSGSNLDQQVAVYYKPLLILF